MDAIIISIFILACAILTSILSYKNYRLNKKNATKKPNLTLNIYDSESRRNVNFKTDYFIVAGNLSPERILRMPLIITLRNNGDKTAKNITMEMNYSKRLRGGGLAIAEIAPRGFSKENSPKVFENRHFQTVRFEIDFLTPEQPFDICDSITIPEETRLEGEVSCVSRDGVPFKMDYQLCWANRIDFTVYQDDYPPISGSFAIRFIDTSKQSLTDYLKSYNEQKEKEYREIFGSRVKFDITVQEILHYLKLELSGKATIQGIQFVVFDESKVKHNSKVSVDEVPPEALKYFYGLEDIKGCIHAFR